MLEYGALFLRYALPSCLRGYEHKVIARRWGGAWAAGLQRAGERGGAGSENRHD